MRRMVFYLIPAHHRHLFGIETLRHSSVLSGSERFYTLDWRNEEGVAAYSVQTAMPTDRAASWATGNRERRTALNEAAGGGGRFA